MSKGNVFNSEEIGNGPVYSTVGKGKREKKKKIRRKEEEKKGMLLKLLIDQPFDLEIFLIFVIKIKKYNRINKRKLFKLRKFNYFKVHFKIYSKYIYMSNM